jgi:hypothetical protein
MAESRQNAECHTERLFCDVLNRRKKVLNYMFALRFAARGPTLQVRYDMPGLTPRRAACDLHCTDA